MKIKMYDMKELKQIPLKFNFQDKLKKALLKRNIDKAMIGTIALKVVTDFFVEKNKKYGEVEGFLKFDTLFIKTANQSLKIDAYRDQTQILENINKRLLAIWYEKKVRKILFTK